MSFTKLDDGRVVIPDDFTGNLELAKIGYPDGTQFVRQSEVGVKEPEKPEDKLLDEPPAGGGDDILKELGFNTKEELKTRFDAFKQREKELQEEVERAKQSTPVTYDVDEDTIKESIFRKENPEKYSAYMRLKYGNLGEEDVIALGLMEENPEMFSSIDEARSYVNMKYGDKKKKELPSDADDEDESRIKSENQLIEFENKDNKLKRKNIANEYKTKMLSVFDKIEIPKKEQDTSAIKEMEGYIKSWQPKFQQTIMGDKSITFGEFVYNLDEETVKVYRNIAAQFVANNKLEISDKEVENIRNYAGSVIFATKKEDILQEYGNYVRKLSDKEWEDKVAKKFFNSSGIERKDEKNPDAGKTKNTVDDYLANLEKRKR